MAEEEASLPKKKAVEKPGPQKSKKNAKTAPSTSSNNLEKGDDVPTEKHAADGEAESFAASNIDDALELLEVVTAKMDKASVGQQAAEIEKHPEVLFSKRPFASFKLIG